MQFQLCDDKNYKTFYETILGRKHGERSSFENQSMANHVRNQYDSGRTAASQML